MNKKLFLSAVSSEFEGCRQLLAGASTTVEQPAATFPGLRRTLSAALTTVVRGEFVASSIASTACL